MNEVADPFAPEAIASLAVRAAKNPTKALDEANFFAREDTSALPVLALDLGTACGYALRTRGGVTSGTLDLSHRKRDNARGDRLLRFYAFLLEVNAATPLAWIAHEDVAHMGRKQMLAAHSYAQFEGVLALFAARNRVPVRPVHTSTLKKAITGRGSWPKDQSKPALMAAVRARGFTPSTQDEADAIAVLEWALGK